MTPETMEASTVTNGAPGLIYSRLIVRAMEFAHVVGGLEVGLGIVALLATEWVIDLVVAHQTIGHLRHASTIDGVGLVQSTVAGLADNFRIELCTNVAHRLQVVLLIDRRGDDRRDVPHLQMLCVAEM